MNQIKTAIQPHMLVYALETAAKKQPEPGPEEGTVVVELGPVNTEGFSAEEVRFCFVEPNSVKVVKGKLPAIIPKAVTFADDAVTNMPPRIEGLVRLELHLNGTVQVKKMAADPKLLVG